MTEKIASRAGAALIERVFGALADGQFHSGEDLARALGVSRSAVWKAARGLRELGSTLHAVRNRGYRLASTAGLLAAGQIREGLSRAVRECVRHLDVAWSVDSTNTVLLARAAPPAGKCEVLLAEFQTAGRGRQGRAWLAPPGGAICLSLSWTYAQVPRDIGALSLAIGVCVLRALESLQMKDLRLKWPNDILLGERKLGGILIELRAESGGPACAVIGVGLNVALGAAVTEKIGATGLAAADMTREGSVRPGRNALAASVIDACVHGLMAFEREGLRPFIEEWRHADALRGRAIAVLAGEERTRGFARGVDLSGALLVETPQGLRKLISGEVSVRPVS